MKIGYKLHRKHRSLKVHRIFFLTAFVCVHAFVLLCLYDSASVWRTKIYTKLL